MFFDMGPLEVLTLIILGVIVFGPDKLPKVVKDISAFIRKIRDFSENAREDIRKELGPEFRDFEFEDLNPRNFVRKHLLDNDDLALRELRELRGNFDFRQDMAELTEAVNGRDKGAAGGSVGFTGLSGSARSSGTPERLRKPDRLDPGEPPPFDPDAT